MVHWIATVRNLAISVAVILAFTGAALSSPVTSQSWFSKLSPDERTDIQANLILLAHYGGMVDGAFGAGTYSALLRWQQSVNQRPSGVLTLAQMTLLKQMASDAMNDLGMELIEDIGGHLAIMLPMKVLTSVSDRVNGTWYQDGAGLFTAETFWRTNHEGSLAELYAEATKSIADGSITYSTLRSDMYVVTGYEGDRYFYELVHADGVATAGFRFKYDEAFRDIGGIASVFAASYSTPINVIEAARDNAMPQVAAPATTVMPQIALPDVLPGSTAKTKAESESGVRFFGNFFTVDTLPGILVLRGNIGAGAPLDFRRALRSMPDPETLVLASDGGLVASALVIAYEIADLGLSTYVMPDTGCYSACSFIFLAGKERLAEGALGVHQVWGDGADASSAQTVVSDILEAFNEFGVKQEVTSAMLRTLPEDMYIFSSSELNDWGLNTR